MWSKVDYPDIFLSMWEITKKKLMMRAWLLIKFRRKQVQNRLLGFFIVIIYKFYDLDVRGWN
jgi:hypothetical protein